MHILEYENYEETKKHYDTDFSYNTYPCSIPLDFPCVPMHWHRETEIIYVKSGRGMVNVERQHCLYSTGQASFHCAV